MLRALHVRSHSNDWVSLVHASIRSVWAVVHRVVLGRVGDGGYGLLLVDVAVVGIDAERILELVLLGVLYSHQSRGAVGLQLVVEAAMAVLKRLRCPVGLQRSQLGV